MSILTAIVEFFSLDPTLTPLMVEQTAWIPIAIAAVSAAGSLYAKYKEGQDAKGQANLGNEMTEAARQQAMQRLSPEALYTAFQTFFPGLVSDPGNTADPSFSTYSGPKQDLNVVNQDFAPGSMMEARPEAPNQSAGYQAPNPQADANDALAQRLGYDGARAQGGSMQAGGSYIVGEQGPEVVTPRQDAQVTPNPATTGEAPPAPAAGQTGDVGIAPPGGNTPAPEPITSPGGEATPTTTGGFQNEPVTANELMMNRIYEMLANPGDFSTADYERRQEDAARGYQSRVQDINAQAMMGGIDPGSGVAGSLMAGAARDEANLKSEAARDQQLLEQQLRRADIAAGGSMFMSMMNYILQLQASRASVASGQFANPQIVNMGLGSGIAQAGDLVGQAVAGYNANKPDDPGTGPAPDTDGSGVM
jgi:hypothetical protein